ncbi:30S ribosomal protein S12 methylthiotransferase RimO [Desulfolithobacter sp.]
MKKLHLVSLGCPKNLVDSEVMLGLLEKEGFSVVEDPARAELLLVNTCGFIRPAVEEAVDEILELARYRKDNPEKRLVVTGCLVQRYGEELERELPEVDLFVGTDGFQRIGELVCGLFEEGREREMELRHPPKYLMDARVERRLSTPAFRAWLKITEGCDNRCTYCMIPSIRGGLRSRSIEDLVEEAIRLQAGGVQELTLIGQDLTAYGNDLSGRENLEMLLGELLHRTTIPWLRLLYLYPSTITRSLLELMAAEPRVVPYLDVPFQHVSDRILRAMNRHHSREDLERLINNIRTIVPECAIRTTLLVGFPGETEEDVEQVVECLTRWQLDHVGVFQYQDEEGSAACLLPDKVEDEVKEERYNRVMSVQADISARRQAQYVGRTEPVLLEGVSRESDLLLEGRTRFQAPDIDGCVYITDGMAEPGSIVPVRIIEAHTYDLVGIIVDDDQC